MRHWDHDSNENENEQKICVFWALIVWHYSGENNPSEMYYSSMHVMVIRATTPAAASNKMIEDTTKIRKIIIEIIL